jgi:hypothetical protein
MKDDIDIPEEVLETFDWREMWINLYIFARSRNWTNVVDYMDEVEQTELEIYQDKL